MRIPVSTRTSYSMANKVALVDSGATDNFIHPNFAARMGLKPAKLERPRKIWNIDNTENEAGMITVTDAPFCVYLKDTLFSPSRYH